MKPRTGMIGADIIIDEAGQTWVTAQPPHVWPRNYVKIEELRAEDHCPAGNTGPGTGRRSGRPSQWDSSRPTGGNSYITPGFEFIRNDFALSPEALEQIRLYAQHLP